MPHSANPFAIAQQQLALAAELMGLDEATHELPRWPMRQFRNRLAAYTGAVARVAEACKLRGWV